MFAEGVFIRVLWGRQLESPMQIISEAKAPRLLQLPYSKALCSVLSACLGQINTITHMGSVHPSQKNGCCI